MLVLLLFPVIFKSQTIPTTTVTGCLKVDSTMSTSGNLQVSGTTTMDSSLVVSSDIKAEDIVVTGSAKIAGNMDVIGDANVTGKLTAAQGIYLDNTNSVRISSSSTPAGNIISYGKILPVVPTCSTPNTGNSNIMHVFPGFMTSVANTTSFSAALNVGSAPWNGSGYIEVEGTDQLGNDNNGLFINYFCGRNTFINVGNTGAVNPGGNVYFGDRVNMRNTVKIGNSGNDVFDLNTGIELHNGSNPNWNGIKFITPWNGAKVISISNSNFTISPFTVFADGRTRIGAQSLSSRPNSLLTVSGEIDCKSLFVLKPTTWSDYVFSKTYKLDNEYAEEKYILKNGHLKGVPSEKEVLANGYDLNEMDAALLAKLEQSFLYNISLRKEVDELKKEMAELKNQMK